MAMGLQAATGACGMNESRARKLDFGAHNRRAIKRSAKRLRHRSRRRSAKEGLRRLLGRMGGEEYPA